MSEQCDLDVVRVTQLARICLEPEGSSQVSAASLPHSDRGLVVEPDLPPSSSGRDVNDQVQASAMWYAPPPDRLLPQCLLRFLEDAETVTPYRIPRFLIGDSAWGSPRESIKPEWMGRSPSSHRWQALLRSTVAVSSPPPVVPVVSWHHSTFQRTFVR
jgi:hypothetical protein